MVAVGAGVSHRRAPVASWASHEIAPPEGGVGLEPLNDPRLTVSAPTFGLL